MTKRWKQDNRGSALVTVLIAVAFLSILITTLLYVAATNYKTKQIDYLNTASFYESEAALEEIKARFVTEASIACEAAYKDVMVNYATKGVTARTEYFKQRFVEHIKTQWEAKSGSDDLDRMRNSFGLTTASQTSLTSVGTWNYDYTNGVATLGPIGASITTAEGYTTLVSATIYLEAPNYNLSINDSQVYNGTDVTRNTIDISEHVVFKDWSKR